MDDRIYDEFGAKRRSGQPQNIPARRDSRQGEFKLSIDFDAIEKREASQTRKANSTAASKPAEGAKASAVQRGSAQPKKSAPSADKKSSTAKSSSSSKAASSRPAKKAPPKKPSSKQKLTPQQLAKAQQMKKYKRTKSLLVTCVCLIFIAIITTTLSVMALQTIDDILCINGETGETVSVVISLSLKSPFKTPDCSFTYVFMTICKYFVNA